MLAPRTVSAAGDTDVFSFYLAKPLSRATQALPLVALCFQPLDPEANSRNLGGPHVP
jgi:hypothetical protein